MAMAVDTPSNERSDVGARARQRAAQRERRSVQSELGEVASAELTDLCGLVNAAHGRMVEVVADVLEANAWVMWGIASPKHWLTWQTATPDAVARSVLYVASRRDELSATVEAMVEGRLSLGLAGLIARYVPAEFEADALDLAGVLTVNQMRRVVTQYCFDVDDPDTERAGEPSGERGGTGSGSDGDGDEVGDGAGVGDGDTSGAGPVGDPADPAPTDEATDEVTDAPGGFEPESGDADGDPADGPGPGMPQGDGRDSAGGAGNVHWFGRVNPIEERRDVSMGVDANGQWYCTIHLPQDEGALFEAAVRNRREDLYRQAKEGLDDDAPRPRVPLADAVVSMAHSILESGAEATPTTDRYLIHAHLTAAPAGGNNLTHHLGTVLPVHLRHLHTCDGTIRPVLERDGTPCNVGRDERIVNRKLRRLIEHRDGGCTVPGCNRRSGLQIHHIIHWEHDGPTDTWNLLTLCRAHHRAHHLGHLQIAGNADLPRHSAPGVCFADEWGRQLRPAVAPDPLPPDQSVAGRAGQLGLAPKSFQHPLGERMDLSAIGFNRRPPKAS